MEKAQRQGRKPMSKYEAWILTPKLEQYIDRMKAGEPVHERVLDYAMRGYTEAQTALIELAEHGDDAAKAELSRLIVRENHLDTDELKRAYAACDLEPQVRTNLLELKAEKGVDWALAILKDQHPQSEQFLDLAANQAEDALLAKVAESQGHWTADRIKGDLRILEQSLLQEGSSTLERILAKRVVICHLTLLYCETIYFRALENERAYVAHSDTHLKRMHQAHERYLAAVKSLAQIRKMRLPNVQVNIGEKQVNIA